MLLGLSHTWQGAEYLGQHPLLSQAYQQGTGPEEQPGLEPLLWKAGITSSGLAHCTTVSAFEDHLYQLLLTQHDTDGTF